VLVFICLYSVTKRFTALSHFWLGASLLLAPVAAWIAILGMDVNTLPTPILLGLAVLFWVAGFDILYACQDAAFDRDHGLHSVPARVGIRASLRIAALCHAVMFGGAVEAEDDPQITQRTQIRNPRTKAPLSWFGNLCPLCNLWITLFTSTP
jgi:4-hydroxybenzoate polyprenyltransferase